MLATTIYCMGAPNLATGRRRPISCHKYEAAVAKGLEPVWLLLHSFSKGLEKAPILVRARPPARDYAPRELQG